MRLRIEQLGWLLDWGSECCLWSKRSRHRYAQLSWSQTRPCWEPVSAIQQTQGCERRWGNKTDRASHHIDGLDAQCDWLHPGCFTSPSKSYNHTKKKTSEIDTNKKVLAHSHHRPGVIKNTCSLRHTTAHILHHLCILDLTTMQCLFLEQAGSLLEPGHARRTRAPGHRCPDNHHTGWSIN